MKTTIQRLIILPLALLFSSACIKLTPSPVDNSQGEILGWAAVALTPDKSAKPQVRYTNTSTTDTFTFSLAEDSKCSVVVSGTTSPAISNKSGFTSYYSFAAGNYFVKDTVGTTPNCGTVSYCSTTTFSFKNNTTYTVTSDPCNATYSVASP